MSKPADKQKMLREHIEAGNVLDEAAIPRSLGPGNTQTLPERVQALYERSVQGGTDEIVVRLTRYEGEHVRGAFVTDFSEWQASPMKKRVEHARAIKSADDKLRAALTTKEEGGTDG